MGVPQCLASSYYVNSDRQKIINGSFQVWQRGTSITYTGTNNAYGFGVDRWTGQVFGGSSGSGTATLIYQQQSFTAGQIIVPGEPQYFCRFNVSALPTKGGGDALVRFNQPIESVRTLAGMYCTYSFWAKADSNRTIGLYATQSFGSGGSSDVSVGSTINLTTSWTYYPVTLFIPSISGKTIGTSDCLRVGLVYYKDNDAYISSPSGTVGTYSTGYIDISEFQVCKGKIALPFQIKPFQDDLRECMRFYEKSYDYATALATATDVGSRMMLCARNPGLPHIYLDYKVPKRAIPAIKTYSTATGTIDKMRNLDSGADVSANYSRIGQTGCTIYSGDSATLGQFVQYHYTADAEL